MSDYCPASDFDLEQEWCRQPKPSVDPGWDATHKTKTFIDQWITLTKDTATQKEQIEVLVVDNTRALEERFQAEAKKWDEETAHLSSTTKRVMHPSYQTIVGMGEQVVPLLLRDLRHNHRLWFWALTHITGANPIKPEHAGNVDLMTADWIEWGTKRSLI